MNRDLLTDAEISAAVGDLSGWTHDDDRLKWSAKFADFSEAFAFMTRVAMIAEQLDHHPNWSNVWNAVEIDVTTHDRGGVTAVDLEFARRVGAL